MVPEGSSLSDALLILLKQSKGHELMMWLATRIIVSRDINRWMEDIENIIKRDVSLGSMIRTFLDIIVQMSGDKDEDYRYSAIMNALQRRIALWIYRSLNQSNNEIRLLRIHPVSQQPSNVKDTKVVSCSLEVRSLDDASLEFDALSYVWGDAMQAMPIFIDNKVLLVSRNLYEALESFRDNGKIPGLLWVDAICINQQDSLERNHQVTLMARLYRQAEKVHIWMGPEMKYTAALFDKLEDCGGDVLRPGWSIMNAIHLTDVESGSLHGLLHLLASPWWSRLWVVQEAELAQNPRVHCGSQEFEFRRLAEVLVNLATMISNELDEKSPVYQAITKSKLSQIQQLFFFLDYSRDNAINPAKLLANTAHCESTVPHDRIYALLGLLPNTLDITPRYEHSIEHVFEEAAFKISKLAGNLELLQITALVDNRKLKLPSWVPEFGNTIDGLHFYAASPCFKADLRATCLIIQDHPRELKVRGMIFDHILGFTRPLNHGLPDPSLMDDIRKNLKSCHDFVQATLPSGTINDLDFCRTITTERLIGSGSGTQRWAENERYVGIAAQWTHFLTDDQYVLEESVKTLFKHSVWAMHAESRLFVTTGNRIGLADRAPMEEGDVLAILAGSDDPAILRPAPERGIGAFTFVQNCYCHGVMDGEAVVEAFKNQSGSDPVFGEKMHEAALANKSMHTRYKFRDAQPKDFQVKLREAIDPLFEEIVLV
ncbi:hypothetical protein ONS95_011878 [Cadophora gregata]|uniref:uncharacterized protein n=1 Tax=Cadophora gregata TaxID=51156 RepID=UPI0026DC7779|nr:uncharacterized protein ONS95_011878 [Cadophora gregata]KAK0117539.1 hypothetical protein ONS95_011878 [Cadophora gregata]